VITEADRPDATPRQRRKRRKRGEIYERALDLFAAKGPSGLTIRELAAELDYTPGALYRYVASKDELLVKVQLLALERIAVGLRAAMAATSEPIAALIAGADYYLALPETLPRESALVQFLIGDPRVLLEGDDAAAVAAPLAALLGEVAAVIQRAVAAGALSAGEPGARAVALWSAIQGAASLRKLARLAPHIDARRVALEQVEALLVHWGGDAGVIGREIEVRS
jgi:AcrR family transcriptional regulator